MKTILTFLLAAVFAAAMGGCSIFQTMDNIKQTISDTRDESQSNINGFGQHQNISVLLKDNGVWVSAKSIPVADTQNPILSMPIELITGKIGLDEIAEEITRRLQIPVRLGPEIILSMKGNTGLNTNNITNTSANSLFSGMPDIGTAAGSLPVPQPTIPQQNNQNTNNQMMSPINKAIYYTNLNYKGDLKGLLESLSARMNVTWEIDNGALKIYRYTSETFTIAAPHGESDFESKMSTKGGSNTQGSAENNSVESKAELNSGVKAHQSPWATIAAAATSMKSPEGKVALNESSGTITITDVKIAVDRVRDYIKEQNNHYLAQAAFSINVYLVALNNTHDLGINYDAFYKKVTGTAFTASSPVGAAVTGAGTLSALILNQGSGSTNSEQAIIDALSVQGDVSTLTTGSITALNHRPSSIRVGASEGYLKSSKLTLTNTVGATTALEDGTLETGSYISVLPNLIDAERMTVQIILNLSENDGIKEQKSGGSSIFVPKKSIREVVNPVYLKSGQTLVLGGLDAKTNSRDETSLGDSWLFGGVLKGKTSNTSMVIVIKPVIL